MKRERLNRIQEILDEMVDTSYVAGVNCLILEGGKEVGYYEAGYASLEQKKPIKRDTIFSLYSMSKPITAAAAMILMERGKIDLLDPVEKFILSFKGQQVIENRERTDCKKPVTIKDLLSMTSGILYGSDTGLTGLAMHELFEDIKTNLLSPKAYTTLEVASHIGYIPLDFQPGTHWAYGASADVLGAVIEVVAEKSFGEFLKENIFDPLGMIDTDFWVPENKRERLAKVYENGVEGLVEYNGNNLGILTSMDKKPRFESGGAGLVSTIDDYKRFATMLLNNGEYEGTRILAPQTVAYMTSCQLPSKLNEEVALWDSLRGHSYGNLMRIMHAPELAIFNGSKGEYGWDGWLGPYFANDPAHNLTFLMMQQKTDTGTTPYTRKLRNIVSSAIE
ncbi:MAG: beta-lactamase family protein [Cellulosilyticum sp.]|nr:beta-lactamase family protein [Cellulosilyticum sp.]